MMTRQRSDYIREIDCLKNEVAALKYGRYINSSYGVITFIFTCSLILTYLQSDSELQSTISTKLSTYGIDGTHKLNLFDRTMLASLYHFLVFKAISHRFMVSILIALGVIACIPGALQISSE
jgi:hypothetical protein